MLQLVRQGAKVVAVARRAERLQALTEEAAVGDAIVTVDDDITKPEVPNKPCKSRKRFWWPGCDHQQRRNWRIGAV
ncbi:MAG: hypothetical protein U0894_13620 [Pirellulales bacterium]